MVRGLYSAATGAMVAQSNVDVIANNLANVNTSGFKRTVMQIEAAPKTELFRDQIDPGRAAGNRTDGIATQTSVGSLGFGSRIYDTPAVFEQGPIQQTNNSLDVALSGPGFLAVRDAGGAIRYTRGGSLTQNARNELVTSDGDAVMGTNGQPVKLQQQTTAGGTLAGAAAPNGKPAVADIKIDPSGSLTSNGAPSGRLAVFEFANLSALRPEGANKFINSGAAPTAATQTNVLQGAQEKSNAQVIPAMVALITNERWFDANQKMMQTQDAELAKAIETVGKSAAN